MRCNRPRDRGQLVIYQSASALASAQQQIEYQRPVRPANKAFSVPTNASNASPRLRDYRRHIAGGVWTASEAVGDAWRAEP